MIKRLKGLNLHLYIIVFLAICLRFYGIHWDSGYHFHPDERMLIMVADRIHFFSQLNPDFFNYGSLPIYILKGVSQLIDWVFKTSLANYDGMLTVGRAISAITDTGVVLLCYHIALSLFKKKEIALWSAFLYAIAFFAIQNSHFFVVDVYLNFFITAHLYLLIIYHNNPTWKKIIIICAAYAAALTTKVSAIIFLPLVVFALVMPQHEPATLWEAIKKFFIKLVTHKPNKIIHVILFFIITIILSFIFMPYGFIERERFINDVMAQVRMNSDAYVFPYTLQYVGTTPYLYYLKNIMLWGLGPIISLFVIIGFIFLCNRILKEIIKKPSHIFTLNVFFFLFYLLYFLIIGKSAVKFMRYMLLMYPFFCILAGYAVYTVYEKTEWMKAHTKAISIALITITLIWSLAFVSIYSRTSTRIRATQWINQFLPSGTTIAVEHWDDRVPIFDPGKYKYVELTLYDQPDDRFKWMRIDDKLNQADYIVIASNRLYTPLQRLRDCEKYKFCYPYTARYYEDLFSGKRGFVQIAQFTSYPRFSFLGIPLSIIDDNADESFTVYDHPKILIFKKIK